MRAVGNKDASTDQARIAASHALPNFRDEPTRELLKSLNADPSEDARDVLARSR